MKKLISVSIACLLLVCLAWGEAPSASLQAVKLKPHHAARHHAHKAVKHHTPRHRRTA